MERDAVKDYAGQALDRERGFKKLLLFSHDQKCNMYRVVHFQSLEVILMLGHGSCTVFMAI